MSEASSARPQKVAQDREGAESSQYPGEFPAESCRSCSYSQQLSTKVAHVLFGRFCDQFSRRRPTPQAVVKFLQSDEEQIRAVGLSRQKRAYLHNLASHFCNDAALTRRFARMDDEAIIQSLIHIKGIGRWTVEMFLIFCLNRPDVWPVDDFGVRK